MLRLIRLMLAATVLLGAIARGAGPVEEPFTVPGGSSPDGKLAVVVFGNLNWNSADDANPTDRESHAFLYQPATHKVLGSLEEIDVDGGGYGLTRENVRADWSPDGSFLAVTFRAGRMLHGFVLYRIQSVPRPGHSIVRAIPQSLPADDSGPDGSAIFHNTLPGPNGGVTVEGWSGPAELKIELDGRRREDWDKPVAAGLNAEDAIRLVYRFIDGRWIIAKYEKAPAS